MLIPRYIEEAVRQDLEYKMVFVSGPRQVGKTTLARSFLTNAVDRCYNWDTRDDRKEMMAARWPAEKATLVFDELHKYKKWKSWIKGEYDRHGDRLRFLITGCARLDIYRKGGDSLQGRYHAHRLHGFSLGETGPARPLPVPLQTLEFPETTSPDILKNLLRFGPFPEPFLSQNTRTLKRWQRERMDRFLREDIRDLENVRDLSALELLADLLIGRVGSPLSIQSLREDLEVSHRAVAHWLTILERLYYCFIVPPYSQRLERALKKIPKVYLWDWSLVLDEGARFENLVAGHLLKLKHALEDQEGYRMGLYYLRDVTKREVDFLMTADGNPWLAVECKMGARSAAPALRYFGERLEIPNLYQVTLQGYEDILDGPVRIMPVAKFLAALP
ncbi:MAG: ATP-binding protein [Desulfobacterota bacterium]|nr:ATP-binding protein [Thermodesulfobacteriota bacterium]